MTSTPPGSPGAPSQEKTISRYLSARDSRSWSLGAASVIADASSRTIGRKSKGQQMGSVELYHGDANRMLDRMIREGLKVHTTLADPPYYLESIVKRFGNGQAAAKFGTDGRFSRLSGGFMGRKWDGADEQGYRIAHDPEFWKRCYELLLPGGFCLAFSSPRTGHRQAVAMEDAGFIMHPFIGWAYGQGWGKAHSVTRAAPEAVEFDGWYYGTQTLKPAIEPIYVGQKPYQEKTGVANIVRFGVGGFNIDGCRAEGGRWPANLIHDGSPEVVSLFPDSRGQVGDAGATEPSKKTKAIYGEFKSRVPMKRRGDEGSAARFFNTFPVCETCGDLGWIVTGSGEHGNMCQESCPVCAGLCSSPYPPLLYYGKAGKYDRAGSDHPTVKPIALLRHLIRLVTPQEGLVLDPFAGSGTTAVAAISEGCDAILVEREDEYAEFLRQRFGLTPNFLAAIS